MAPICKRKTKNGEQIFYSRVPLGKDASGKHRYKTLQASKKSDLSKRVIEFEKDLGIYGMPLASTNISFKEWFHKHLMINCRKSVSAKTFSDYMSLYNNHVLNTPIGNMRLKDVKQLHLQEFFNERTYLATESLKKIRAVFHAVFKTAIANNLIRNNPVDDLSLPRSCKKTKSVKILTQSQQKDYFKIADQQMHGVLFNTLLLCGLRIGEALALLWSDIDLEAATIDINKTVMYTKVYDSSLTTFKYEFVVGPPKTESSKRIIPIPSALLKKLENHRLNSKYPLVFCTRKGNYIHASNASDTHKRICSKINATDIKVHGLRHTYITNLTSSPDKVDAKTLEALTGHSDSQFTFRTYAHPTDIGKVIAINIIENIFGGDTN